MRSTASTRERLRTVIVACLAVAVFASQSALSSSEEPSDFWSVGKTGQVVTWTPDPPENWTYPLLVDFHARNTSYAETIPASKAIWTLKEEIRHIKQEIFNLSMEQREEYDEDRQREIEELEESLQRHHERFVAEDRNRSMELYWHHRNASESGVRRVLDDIDRNPDLNLTVVYAYGRTGNIQAVVEDLETAQWLDDHPFTGALWPADTTPATAG